MAWPLPLQSSHAEGKERVHAPTTHGVPTPIHTQPQGLQVWCFHFLTWIWCKDSLLPLIQGFQHWGEPKPLPTPCACFQWIVQSILLCSQVKFWWMIHIKLIYLQLSLWRCNLAKMVFMSELKLNCKVVFCYKIKFQFLSLLSRRGC